MIRILERMETIIIFILLARQFLKFMFNKLILNNFSRINFSQSIKLPKKNEAKVTEEVEDWKSEKSIT